jgi:hypothetical protein
LNLYLITIFFPSCLPTYLPFFLPFFLFNTFVSFFPAGLPTDVAHYLNCGADRVLLKPLDINAFGQAMKDMEIGRAEKT